MPTTIRSEKRLAASATNLEPHAGVQTFDLDEHLVIYAEHLSIPYILNPPAALVWKELASGQRLTSVVAKMARQAGLPKHSVRRDVDRVLSQWFAIGLLGSSPPRKITWPRRDDSELSVRLRTPADRDVKAHSRGRKVTLRILDFLFQIEAFNGQLIEEIGELFKYAHVSDFDDREAPTRLFLRRQRHRWQLLEEGTVLACCEARDTVVPLVHTFALMLSYLRSASFAAVHGAAVSQGDRCVLMPGRSGDGKSTLAAALVGMGFACYADDLAVLAGPPVQLRPLPTRIGLKKGSWSLLSDVFPELDALPSYARADGQWVKYLLPRTHTEGTSVDATVNVTTLLFPRYSAAGKNLLVPIPQAVALEELSSAGYDLPGQISADWVRAVTEWLRDVPCYTLEFSNVDAAVARVTSLLT